MRWPFCISVMLAAGVPPLTATAQSTRTVVHERLVVPAQEYHESADEVGETEIPWSTPVPDVLRRVVDERLAPVDGPLRLRADPRGQAPPPPEDLNAYKSRFFPTWRWVREPEHLTLRPEAREHREVWEPRAGACYVALAIDTALASWTERQAQSRRVLAWWEAGADVDIQIRDAATGKLIAEDLSRQLSPRVRWCSDGSAVTVDVRLGVPADAPESVDVAWAIAVDESTLPPLRFHASSPLAQRLLWAQSVVAPRSEARSAPAVFTADGPTLIHAVVPVPTQGCELLVVVGEAGIQDLSVAFDPPVQVPGTVITGDFADNALASVPVCASASGEAERRVVIGVREGSGRVALQRFLFVR